MNIIEAVRAMKNGAVVKRRRRKSTWWRLNREYGSTIMISVVGKREPSEHHHALNANELLATDWEIVEGSPEGGSQ